MTNEKAEVKPVDETFPEKVIDVIEDVVDDVKVIVEDVKEIIDDFTKKEKK
jgi:hypothetical protein